MLGDGWRIEMNAFVAGVIALSVVVAAYSSEVWVASLQCGAAAASARRRARSGLDRKRVVLPGRAAAAGAGGAARPRQHLDHPGQGHLADLDPGGQRPAARGLRGSRATLRPILFYGAAALIYLVFSILSGSVQAMLERRANRGYA